MIRAVVVVVVALVATATLAIADADQDFRAAGELAAKNDPRALDAYEAIGAARPISIWTDDAWVEAARIAERRSDFDRARKNLENAIEISSDAQLLRRAKRDLQRLTEMTGGSGEWTKVAADHQRLVTAIADGGDPQAELAELEKLARAHPAYPRGVALRIAIARAWETEDEIDRALAWLRDAIQIATPTTNTPTTNTPTTNTPTTNTPTTNTPPTNAPINPSANPSTNANASTEPPVTNPSANPSASVRAMLVEQDRARIELIRMTIRARELDEARRELPLVRDVSTRISLQRKLETAEVQQLVRWVVAALVAVLAGLALYLLRRRAGSIRAAAKLFARPPIEVLYFAPIAIVVGVFATTGNPLVAKAVIWIFIGAAVVAWISGATLEAARRGGPIGVRHAIVHAIVVGVAALAAVYLAVDHARLVDLVAETWRTGPGH